MKTKLTIAIALITLVCIGQTSPAPSDIVKQLEQERDSLKLELAQAKKLNQSLAQTVPQIPLPVYVPEFLHIRQVDTNEWQIKLSEGYEFHMTHGTNNASSRITVIRK